MSLSSQDKIKLESMTNNQIIIDDIIDTIKPVDNLEYEHVDHRYRSVQLILTGLGYMLIAALALFLLLIDDHIWCILAECVIFVAMAINLNISNKAWKFKGYALRENDISYRSGLIFPTITTIPFDRIQQVSVKQNPVSKYFSMYAVEIVNGGQYLSSLTIQGLTKERANQIKSIVIEKLKHDDE